MWWGRSLLGCFVSSDWNTLFLRIPIPPPTHSTPHPLTPPLLLLLLLLLLRRQTELPPRGRKAREELSEKLEKGRQQAQGGGGKPGTAPPRPSLVGHYGGTGLGKVGIRGGKPGLGTSGVASGFLGSSLQARPATTGGGGGGGGGGGAIWLLRRRGAGEAQRRLR